MRRGRLLLRHKLWIYLDHWRVHKEQNNQTNIKTEYRFTKSASFWYRLQIVLQTISYSTL